MPKEKCPPTFTEEARQAQLINLAYDLLEKRLRDGSATSQEVTTMVRQGTERAKIQLDILKAERDLTIAKTESLKREADQNDMFQRAIDAMHIYNGEEPEYLDESELFGSYPDSYV